MRGVKDIAAWLDDDDRHVWVGHDCATERVVTMLPWPRWHSDGSNVVPSFSCDGCGVHTSAQLGVPEDDESAAVSTPTTTVLMGYPWSMRPSSFTTIGSHHIVLTEEMHRGRWHRIPGDALCKPRSKFRYLDTEEGEHRRKEGQKFDCLTCLIHNERLGLVAADECGEPRYRSYR